MNHKQEDWLPLLASALYFTLCGSRSDFVGNVLDCVPAQCTIIYDKQQEEGALQFIKLEHAVADSGLM